MTQSSNRTSARGLDSCNPSQTARRAPPQVLDMVDQSRNFVRNQSSANKQRRREETTYYLDIFDQSSECSGSAMRPSHMGTTQQSSAPAERAMDPSQSPVEPDNSAMSHHVNSGTPMQRHAATPYTTPVGQPLPTNLTPQQYQQYRQRQQWLSQQVPVQQQMLAQRRACQQAMMYPRQPNTQVNPQMLAHAQSQACMTSQRQVPGQQQHAKFQQAMYQQQQQPMLANRSPQMGPPLAQYPATGFRGEVTGDPGPSTQRVVGPQTPEQEARPRSSVNTQSRLQGMQQQQRRLEILRMQRTSQNNQHNPVPMVQSPVPRAPTPELQAQARHRPSAQQQHYRDMQQQGQFQTHVMQGQARQYQPGPFLNQPQPVRPQATQMLENQAQAFSRITELSPSSVPQDQALRMANRATSTAPQLRGQLGNHNGNLTVPKTMPPGEGFDRNRSTTVSDTGRKRTFQQTSEDGRNLSSSPPVSKDQQQQKKQKIDKGKTSVREAPTPLPTEEEHIRLSGTSTAATRSPPPPGTSSTEPATEFDELFETTVAAQSQDSPEESSVIDPPAAPASTSTDVTSIGHTLSSDEYVKSANSPCTSPENWSISTGVDAGHQKSPDLEASAVLTKEELEEFAPLIAFLGRVEERGEMSMLLDQEY
ncbi:hypothetical protein LTR05_004092 [Lithohypha guttulata]|uniref:Uncharacterized protein n=1 Tax=Lithohypha guttulata TaxID=1690604 RepID=A0AAN7T113_9EURO|nr:hypothetical protein LTR05_004092 [Lithohypha guttulata]